MLRDVTCSCSWGKTQLPTTTFWVDHLRFRSRAKNPPRTLNSPNQFRERRSSVHRQLFLESFCEQQLGPYPCFVAEAVPKRKDKYLFEGRVWIDVNDYSVVRIEGHPARKLSLWIQHADFVRQYQPKLMASGFRKGTRRLFRYGCTGRKSRRSNTRTMS